ncbi:hypothetical protein IV203_012301 [Nitzschia inconspicua]|uniref:Uncharacterized protein n=1 Tax=Nitzschia inconspicua TaxID=303405 RepID=A0A9K3KUS5_9STRA|nr:hypothetical protein IV203_012301 [Nitzschia inconspicua]
MSSTSDLDEVIDSIKKVEEEIRTVEASIKAVEAELKKDGLREKDVDYYREEKKQLREEKNKLRDEKNKLREKENKLRDEKSLSTPAVTTHWTTPSREEQNIVQQYRRLERQRNWPVKRGAVKKFATDPFLIDLRTCNFVGFEHQPELIRDIVLDEEPNRKKSGRRKCVLCFVPKKFVPEDSRYKGQNVSNNSSYMCRVCMVVLCNKPIGVSGAKTCHEVWHTKKNLDAEAFRYRKQLLEYREKDDDEAKMRRLQATKAHKKKWPVIEEVQEQEHQVDVLPDNGDEHATMKDVVASF